METVNESLNQAKELRKKGKFAEAIDKYSEALKLNPDFVPALNQLSAIHEDRQEFEKAIHYLQKAVKLRPKAPLIQAKLAKVMMKLGNLKEAIATYEKALSLQPQEPAMIYQELGDALKQNGQIDRAVETYQKAIKFNPDNLYCYQQLQRLGYSDEFYQCCHEALKLNPNHITLHKFYLDDFRGYERKQNQLETALKIIKDKSKLQPLNINTLRNIFMLEIKLGNLDEAEYYVNQALTLEPENSDALFAMGMILEKKREWTEASNYYKGSEHHDAKVKFLTCLYQSDRASKSIIDREIRLALKTSKAIEFIESKILSKLDIEYKNNLILYIPSANVGDTCKLLALIKSLCIQHDRKAIVFYPNLSSPIVQARLFLDPLMPKYIISHFPIDVETHQKIRKLSQSDKLPLHRLPIVPGRPGMMTNYPEAQQINYIIDESIYKGGKAASIGLNIELNSDVMGQPAFKPHTLVNSRKKFDDLNLSRGKAILIAPDSTTMNKISGSNLKLNSFWKKFIRMLSEKNITPVINARNEEERLGYLSILIEKDRQESIKFVDIPLDEVIPFVELCGSFAGARSGLCDLVAFSSQNVTKLCIELKRGSDNCFGKLPEIRVPDASLLNENFNLYFASTENLPGDEQIEKMVNLFTEQNH